MNNTPNHPAHLTLNESWLERLGKDVSKGDAPWLEPSDIINIAAGNATGCVLEFKPEEVQHALGLSRDSLMCAAMHLQVHP